MSAPEDDRWLRTALQEEARRHMPDREAMLRRIEARRRRRLGPRARTALQLAVTAVAVTAVVVPVTVLITSSAERPVVTAGSTPGPGRGGDAAAGAAVPTAPLITASGRVNPHSNPWWSQNDLNLTLTRPVTEMDVTVRIRRAKDVRYAGGWRTLPETHFDHTYRVEDGALVYRWTLRPGVVVQAGEHAFGIQYHHAEEKRTGRHDRFTITVTGEDGTSATVTGDFGG